MESLQTLATLLPLALTSGINLYATILVVGLCIRFDLVQNTPPSLDVLASWPVLVAAAAFYLVEFLADKIQFVDNLWDMLHTIIRPLGAMLLAVAALGDMHPALKVIAVLAAGSVALISHTGKAGSRAVVNVTSPMENVSNIFISLTEDAAAGALSYLALRYPYIATGVAVVILIVLVLLIPTLLRWLWFTIRAVLGVIKRLGQSLLGQVVQADPLPVDHMIALKHQEPQFSAQCRVQAIRGLNGRSGYVSIGDGRLVFTCVRRGEVKAWSVPLNQVITAYLRRRLLMDIVEAHYQDEKEKHHLVRFVFLKDRAPLAEQLAALLKNKP